MFRRSACWSWSCFGMFYFLNHLLLRHVYSLGLFKSKFVMFWFRNVLFSGTFNHLLLRHVYSFGLFKFVMFCFGMFYFPAGLTIFFFGMFILSVCLISMHISGQVLVFFFVVVVSVDVRQAGPDCSCAALSSADMETASSFCAHTIIIEWPTVNRSRSKRYSYHLVLLWSLWPK